MKYLITLLACLVCLVQLPAQNLVHDNNAEVRTVAAFRSIKVNGGISVYVSQGSGQAVAVSAADKKNNSKIQTVVVGDELRISIEAGMWNNFNVGNKKIKAYVTVTELSGIQLNGGSIVRCTDPIRVNAFQLEINGGSIFNGILNGTELSATLHGGSIANIDGQFASAKYVTTGGSILNGCNTALDNCSLSASGGSIAHIRVNKQMLVNASGGSIVNYSGEGMVKEVNATGGAMVKKTSCSNRKQDA
jgi:hypothetical protein